MPDVKHYIGYVAEAIEIAGVTIMVVGLLYAFFVFTTRSRLPKAYEALRLRVGKAILLGLEILVAADIITTITTEPTIQSTLILGLIVLIRTFLSFSLEVELEGKWPWQQGRPARERPDRDKSGDAPPAA